MLQNTTNIAEEKISKKNNFLIGFKEKMKAKKAAQQGGLDTAKQQQSVISAFSSDICFCSSPRFIRTSFY